MTGHDVTPARHEARWIENAVIGILTNCLEQRAPSLTTCPDCRALIAAALAMPHLRRDPAQAVRPTTPQDRLDQTRPGATST
jgi:hypothetical protein